MRKKAPRHILLLILYLKMQHQTCDAAIAQRGTFHPATPGSSPKHTIYDLINLYLNFFMWKRRK